MDQKFIPEDVAQFVTDKIDSVAELEALLLLRNAPEREWTARELSQRQRQGRRRHPGRLVGQGTGAL
jgi:hypothetical protein